VYRGGYHQFGCGHVKRGKFHLGSKDVYPLGRADETAGTGLISLPATIGV
jgi:hypothetical protein